jgi:hypothetical protein
VSLTADEKAAGRAFRDERLADLAALPPAARCSSFIREYRHSCPRSNGVSVAVRMKEHYELSPSVFIGNPRSEPGPGVFLPAGLFAFIWLDGTCTCGLTVRSSGRIVLAAERGPHG